MRLRRLRRQHYRQEARLGPRLWRLQRGRQQRQRELTDHQLPSYSQSSKLLKTSIFICMPKTDGLASSACDAWL
eukprot:4776146-Pyramimonas_sp.AAC.1